MQSRRETNCSLQFVSDRCGSLLCCCGWHGRSIGWNPASRLALRTLYNQIQVVISTRPFLDDPALEEILADAVDVANHRIYGVGTSTKGYEGMGTTLTFGMEYDGRLVIGHVGDSRAYLMREDGIGQLTSDQSVVASKLLAGELTEIEARFHPERNILLQALAPIRSRGVVFVGQAPSLGRLVAVFRRPARSDGNR